MGRSKIIIILIGLGIIFLFLASFFQSKSPLDLFLITVGIMMVVIGFNIEGNETSTYFMTMFCVNIFQWIILIYILFLSQVNVTTIFGTFSALTIAPVITIYLIYRIRKRNVKYFGNDQGTNKDIILVDKVQLMLSDKAKIILISVGIMVMMGCLVSFSQSKSGAELFGSSVGLLMIVYGFFREDKKVKVTMHYFLAILCVNLVQWFILFFFMSHDYEPDTVPAVFTFISMFTLTFWIQIRESDLEYFGKRRKIRTKDNGYIVCNKCNRYYKLKSDESPENFPNQCECGGKFEYKYKINNQS